MTSFISRLIRPLALLAFATALPLAAEAATSLQEAIDGANQRARLEKLDLLPITAAGLQAWYESHRSGP